MTGRKLKIRKHEVRKYTSTGENNDRSGVRGSLLALSSFPSGAKMEIKIYRFVDRKQGQSRERKRQKF